MKTLSLAWTWQLNHPPAELWPYVADTNRLNQVLGLKPIDVTAEPLEIGGSVQRGQLNNFGVVSEFEERPFEWVRGQWFKGRREFLSGPFVQADTTLHLEPTADGTTLHFDVEVISRNVIASFAMKQVLNSWQKRYDEAFEQIEAFLDNEHDRPFSLTVTPLSAAGQARLTELCQKLRTQGHPSELVERLSALISQTPDSELARLRPYPLAKRWDASKRAVLELFLSAAKLGLFNMHWDLICPLCRGASLTATTLDEVKQGVHCTTCNINYESNFSENVELTFTPHPQIKSVYQAEYCVGGPMLTPHILVHQILEPGETRTVSLPLSEGSYRLRTQNPATETFISLTRFGAAPESTVNLQVFATADNLTVAGEQRPGQVSLTFTNQADHEQGFYLERAEWVVEAVTAAEVTTLQHFRDLFSDQVLRPGEEIGISGMTILFSDLVGSTAMYNAIGDAPSYALVREQFAFLQRIVRRFDGAIIKTIGDSIMAAFVNPVRAVNAALTIQRELAQFNAKNQTAIGAEGLKIRLGLHHGPCIAVNLNGQLDYFGTTVNLAARLEGLSFGDDVVISEHIYTDPGVTALLEAKSTAKSEAQQVQTARFTAPIKGFDDNFALYRITFPKNE